MGTPLPEYGKYLEMLRLISSVCNGDSLPGELESRIKDQEDTWPLTSLLGGVLVSATNHIADYNDLPPAQKDNPEVVKKFLQNNEVLCRTQGALAVVLLVGEFFLASEPSPPSARRLRIVGDSRDNAKAKKAGKKAAPRNITGVQKPPGEAEPPPKATPKGGKKSGKK